MSWAFSLASSALLCLISPAQGAGFGTGGFLGFFCSFFCLSRLPMVDLLGVEQAIV
jgi:hypothetical protein